LMVDATVQQTIQTTDLTVTNVATLHQAEVQDTLTSQTVRANAMFLDASLVSDSLFANSISVGAVTGDGLVVDGNIQSSNLTVTEVATLHQAEVQDTLTSQTVRANAMFLDASLVSDSLFANSISVGAVTGDGLVVDGNIQSSNLTVTEVATLFNATIAGNLTSNVVTSNIITTDRIVINRTDDETGGGGITGTFPARADVITDMAVDGDLFQYGGTIYGNGAGLTGFSGKQNVDLEARLRLFSESPHRLYVSTTGSDSNVGNSPDQALRTLKKACSISKRLTTIFIESGEYIEANPIYVPEQVSIIGDSLRNVIIYAMDPFSDVFHVNSFTYFNGLRFVDLQAPGYCVAFPAAISDRVFITPPNRALPEGTISASDGVLDTTLNVTYSPKGYYSLPLPVTPGVTETTQTARNDVTTTTVTATANSPLLFFESLGAFDVRDLFDTVSVGSSLIPLRGYLILAGKQYQVVSINSALGVTINDNFDGTTLDKAPFDFGSSQWQPQPSPDGVYTDTDVRTDIDNLAEPLKITIQGGNPTWEAVTGTMVHAASLLLANKAFIQAETMAYIASTYPTLLDDTLTAKCKRDVGYLVTAWANDLASGGYVLTQQYASYYNQGAVLPALPSGSQITPTVDSITHAQALAKDIAVGVRVVPLQRGVIQSMASIGHDPFVHKTYVAPGSGLASTRTFTVTASDQAVGYGGDHMLDYYSTQPTLTQYKSAGIYRNFNGTRDAEDVYIDIECPKETMVVGYSFSGAHNLKKWKLQARCTPYTDWDTIDTREVLRKTDFAAIQGAITGLIAGFTTTVDTGSVAFDDQARDREGGYTQAGELLVSNRSFIQAEAMAWIAREYAELMTEQQTGKCQRDVGYIVDALVNDLATGGADMTIDYSKYYLRKFNNKDVLPADQKQPTIDSMNYVRDLAINVATKTLVTPLQATVKQSFVQTSYPIASEARVYRTTATTKYTYYRLLMLQNTDSAQFEVTGLTLHEFWQPKVLCDGPPQGDSRVERIEMVDGGSGYSSSPAPRVTIKHIDPDQTPLVYAEATATVSGGAVTEINLKPFTSDFVSSISISPSNAGGSGYRSPPTVTVAPPPSGVDVATAKAFIDKTGSVTEIVVVNRGSGYTSNPDVTISAPPSGGTTATATASRSYGLMYGKGYARAIVEIDPPTAGTTATAIAITDDDYCEMECPLFLDESTLNMDLDGRITQVNITKTGSGYYSPELNPDVPGSERIIGLKIPPTISIQPPLSKQPFVVASPYIQNCSNIGGPFLLGSKEKVPATTPLPYDVNDVYGNGEVIDEYGGGGGCRIDGNCCSAYTPLRSMVLDAFTQVNQGCIAFLLTNLAYAQFVSTFSTFSSIHFLTLEGSFANASNSVTDFGLRGLVSRGKARVPYLRGRAKRSYEDAETNLDGWDAILRINGDQYVETKGYRSFVDSITVKDVGEGYQAKPSVIIDAPADNGESGTIQATAVVPDTGFVGGTVAEILITEQGMGYRAPPSISFDGLAPLTKDATAEASISGVSKFRIEITDISQRPNNTKPDVTSLVRVHGQYYTVTEVSQVKIGNTVVPNVWDIRIGGQDRPPYIDLDAELDFFQPSYLSTGSHVFEYSGSYDQSGVTYNSLPQYGGVSVAEYQIIQQNKGKVFYTSSDHTGNFRVGDNFAIDQATGSITFDLSNAKLDLTGVQSIKFQKGTEMDEFSDNPALISSSGVPGPKAGASQNAIVTYMKDKRVPAVNENTQNGYVLQVVDKDTNEYAWNAIDLGSAGVTQAVIRADVVNGLIADGDTKVFGNLDINTATDTYATVECGEGSRAAINVYGEKSGAQEASVHVGQTSLTGGGLVANATGLHLCTRSNGQDMVSTSFVDDGFVLTAPNGNRYKITVDNDGTLLRALLS